MLSRCRTSIALTGLALLLFGAALQAQIVVTGVSQEGPATKLSEGDLALAWASGDEGGSLTSPIELELLRKTVAPVALVKIEIQRASGTVDVLDLGPAEWNVSWAPSRYQQDLEPVVASALHDPDPASALERLRRIVLETVSTRPCLERVWLVAQVARSVAAEKKLAGSLDEWLDRLEEVGDECGATLSLWSQQQVATIWASSGALEREEKSLEQALLDVGRANPTPGDVPWKLGSRDLELWRAQLEIKVGGVRRDRGTLRTALDSFESASRLLQTNRADRRLLAQAQIGRADLLVRLGQTQEAHEILNVTLEGLRGQPESAAVVAAALNGLGRLRLSESEYRDLEAADRALTEALDLIDRFRLPRTSRLDTLGNLGVVAVYRGQLDLAQARFAEAHRLREESEPPGPNWGISLNNLGGVAYRRGDMVAAQDYFERAVEVALRFSPDGVSGLSTMQNLAIVYSNRGRLGEAITMLRRVLDVSKTHNRSAAEIGRFHRQLGGFLYERRDYARAATEYDKALEIGGPTPSLLASLGQLAAAQGDQISALKYFDQALEVAGTTSAEDEFFIKMERANALRKSGDLDAARGQAEEVLEAQRDLGDPEDVAAALLRLGEVERDAGRLEEAERVLREALEIRQRLSPESLRVVWSSQILGDVLKRQRRVKEAEELHCSSASMVDRLVLAAGDWEEDRTTLRAAHHRVFRDCADLMAARGEARGALEMLESLRGQNLRGQMAERMLDLSAAVPVDLRTRLLRNRVLLQQEIAKNRASQSDPRNGTGETVSPPSPTQVRVLALREERRLLFEELRLKSPQLADLHQVGPRPTVERLSSLLPEKGISVHYLVGRDRSWAFVLDPTSQVAAFPIAVEATALEDLVESFRRDVTDPSRPEAYRPLARRLGSLLFGPIRSRLVPGTEVILAPDGPLHGLPFAAILLGNDGSEGAPDDRFQNEGDRFLIELATLRFSLVPDLGSAVEPSNDRLSKGSRLLAIADPEIFEAENDAEPPPGLPPLPGARLEVQEISKWFQEPVLRLGRDATIAELIAEAPAAQVVHLSVHTDVAPLDPLATALRLASEPSTPAEKGSDGRFEAWQIAEDLSLTSDLVTLASCETALGSEVAGEGFLGLMRTFRLIGAKRVVASLWRVEDMATSTLMVDFYRLLADGRPFGQALAQAQRSMIAGSTTDSGSTGGSVAHDATTTRAVGGLRSSAAGAKTHPYFWAAFNLYE